MKRETFFLERKTNRSSGSLLFRRTSMSRDEEHLKHLSIAHYWVGGVGMLFSFFPILHVVLGLIAIRNPEKLFGNAVPPPFFFGWMFLIIGIFASNIPSRPDKSQGIEI
jgi:hypothetical protein